MEAWKNDTTTWADVYAKKPVEYLEAIARGEIPRWDSESKKYVYGDDAVEVFGGSNMTVDPQSGMNPDDELPF
jgi:hypothetical protein